MFKFIIATLCIACCIDYNEAKNGETRTKAKQWYGQKKERAKEFGENVKGKAKKKAEEIGENVESSAKRKLYNKAFEFYILPIGKKRSELVDMLSSKTTINMLVGMYSLISGKEKDELILQINGAIKDYLVLSTDLDIMTAKKQDIEKQVNSIDIKQIENLSKTLVRETFKQMRLKEKQDWLVDKLKKRSGIKMLNDAYKYEQCDNNDIDTEIKNALGIDNVGKTKEKQIKEAITSKEEKILDSFFEKIHPKEENAEIPDNE